MSDYGGRLIRATEPTVSTTTASGIWTVEEALKYTQAGTWPVQAAADPNFKQTVLLLHGDGTNGAQNNTFLDSSTNNFTITRNGNTTQGTFSPFSVGAGEWSNYFDGSGDYLSVASNAAFAFGTGDFTVEFWYYKTAEPSTTDGLVSWNYLSGVHLAENTTGIFVWVGGTEIFTTSTKIPINSWNHVALSRSGTTARLFLNGAQVSSTTSSQSVSANNLFIGASTHNTAEATNGYISNVRLLKGTAQYTSAFTPPTTPLTAITNTSLLTCQSNRFVDNSTNAFAITRNGDVRVTPFSPFAPTAAYSAGTNGGSGYFDGTGDRLTFATGQTPLLLGNSDFTFEAWVYRLNTNSACIFQGQADLNTAPGSSYVFFVGSSTSDLYISSTGYSVTSPNPPVGEWAHVAYVRSGGTYSSYLNGARVGTRADLSTLSVNNGSTTYGPSIGGFGTGTNQLTGYIGSARLIKGSGGYDATQTSITIPTAPLTAITNTSLLLNFTNAGIFDNTGKNVLETVGNAQIDTTTKKYGTGSMEFDGTGDELILPATPDLVFGTNRFTVEAWIYPNNATSGSTQDLMGNLTNAGGTSNWTLQLTSTGVLQAGVFDAVLANSGSTTVSSTTWSHIAFTYDGTTYRVFINGTVGTTTSTTQRNINDAISRVKVGNTNFGTRNFNGFIDDLRITKGVARYTANFTPPAAEFQDN